MNWNRVLVYLIFNLAAAMIFTYLLDHNPNYVLFFVSLSIASGYVFGTFQTIRAFRKEIDKMLETESKK